jgi:phage terminase small subunit
MDLTKLTDKQKAFCEEYLVDFNGMQAAIRAGYSEKTARSIAAENLTKPYMQEYLLELKAERANRVKISQDDVLRELIHIAFDDIKNYLDFRTEKAQVDTDKNGMPVYGYKTIVDVKDSDGIDTRNVQEVSLGANGSFKFRLYSKDEALLQLGRHLGLFTDNLNMQGKVDFNSGGLAETLAELKKRD